MPSFSSVFLFHKQQVICFTLAVKQVLNFSVKEQLSEKINCYNITHSLEDKICLKIFSHGTALQLKANDTSRKLKDVSVLRVSWDWDHKLQDSESILKWCSEEINFPCDVHIGWICKQTLLSMSSTHMQLIRMLKLNMFLSIYSC